MNTFYKQKALRDIYLFWALMLLIFAILNNLPVIGIISIVLLVKGNRIEDRIRTFSACEEHF